MAHIVFIGPPGAGKGTQCTRLAGRMSVPQIATGELLRAVINQGTALSRWLAQRLDRGHFAPDYLVMQMVTDRLGEDDCRRGCLFDGFPRTVAQAIQMDRMFAGSSVHLDMVLELRVPEEILIERLRERSQTESRADDGDATVVERMRVYQLQTAPVLEYFALSDRVVAIDGLGSVDDVAQRIDEAVDFRVGL